VDGFNSNPSIGANFIYYSRKKLNGIQTHVVCLLLRIMRLMNGFFENGIILSCYHKIMDSLNQYLVSSGIQIRNNGQVYYLAIETSTGKLSLVSDSVGFFLKAADNSFTYQTHQKGMLLSSQIEGRYGNCIN
jgi:hypothetical protein